MKVDLNINPEFEECKLTVCAPEVTEEIEQLLKYIKHLSKKHILGIKSKKLYVLNPDNIFFFFSENKKVIAQTENDCYEVKEKLYELEEQFEGSSFVRISKSAIANIDKVKNFEMFFNGSMCVNFMNGKQEYISRAYVSKIKKYLSIGR